MAYKDYKHLLGLPYIDGWQDCYELIRRYYRDLYEIEIRNWARPADAFHAGMDFFSVANCREEGFHVTDDSLDRLQIGDLLLIAIACKIPNHVAVYVGNNYLLHHLVGGKTIEDSYSGAWKKRTLNVMRHPFVTEANLDLKTTADIRALLPNHVKIRHGLT